MSERFDGEEIRYRLEHRWEKLGYENLLEEERDFVVTWWLEAEASNGTLHQYFSNSTGDSAIDAHDALIRLGAPNAAKILQEAISLFGDTYPTDHQARNDVLDSISGADADGKDIFDKLTDRLFDESEDVQTLALGRVADVYARDSISDVPSDRWSAKRIIAVFILAGITILIFGSLALLTQVGV
jgi:hypothetical protein